MEPILEDLPTPSVGADEVSAPPSLFFAIDTPTNPEAQRVSGPHRITPSASTRVSRSQLQPDGTESKANASSRIDLVVLVDTKSSCRFFRLPSGKAERPAETVSFKHADSIDPNDLTVGHAAPVLLQALCRL